MQEQKDLYSHLQKQEEEDQKKLNGLKTTMATITKAVHHLFSLRSCDQSTPIDKCGGLTKEHSEEVNLELQGKEDRLKQELQQEEKVEIIEPKGAIEELRENLRIFEKIEQPAMRTHDPRVRVTPKIPASHTCPTTKNIAHLLAAASNAVVAAFSELLRFGFDLKIFQRSSHHHRSSPRHCKKHRCPFHQASMIWLRYEDLSPLISLPSFISAPSQATPLSLPSMI
ncbi:hypothetical protein Ahy_B07g086274 isoform E [Arachis hypogaea]|uniref:Uncharacterized protein n=1 Tax=Arachis hypogaea TaxID=3818 RepID=A0A444Y9H1_ARAHY|nr:hypothetical protein Ahy_B07g086274 isoform E [Arachis hypogaea]